MSTTSKHCAMLGEAGAGRWRLEFWPVDRLIPSPRNARTHSDAQIAEIAGSIRAFGFSNPILVSEEGDVIAGHGRLAAARQLGLAEVPVIPLRGLSEVQRRQLVLADNRIALNAGWDMEMLKLELTDLSALGADLSVLGFTEQELAAALAPGVTGGLTDENEVPEVAERPVSVAGDVWCMGAHRLGCGDCTDEAIVKAVLAGQQPQLMVTDPPYGVEYDPAWRIDRGLSNSGRTGKIRNDERADWSAAWSLFPGNIAYVWHARPSLRDGRREPHQDRLRDPQPDHLGEGAARHGPRGLPLAARALLVRRSLQGALDRGPQADDALEHSYGRPGCRDGARDPEAGRVHAPADAQQQRSRPSRLRAVPGQRDDADRGRNDGAHLSRGRA